MARAVRRDVHRATVGPLNPDTVFGRDALLGYKRPSSIDTDKEGKIS
jgi:hypothetical protein